MSESVQRHEPREKSLARQGDFFAAVLESADALFWCSTRVATYCRSIVPQGGRPATLTRIARS